MKHSTTQTRACRNGIRAAKGVRWAGKKLRALDNVCVARIKRKNRPGWLGHAPLIVFTLTVIALLAYFSLYILFAFGFLVILFSIVDNINICDATFEKDVFFAETTDTFNDDGYRDGIESTGMYVDGHRIDD